MKSIHPILAAIIGIASPAVEAAVVAPTEAFATSAWGIPASPYKRDSWSGSQLGISNVDPYGMAAYYSTTPGGAWQATTLPWEETTYLVFDPLDFSGYTTAVSSATLTIHTVGRSGAPSGGADGMTISAHYLTEDPTTIDGTASPNPASGSYNSDNYATFKTNYIDSVVGSVAHGTSYGAYTIDLTDLVNEWIANGDTNYAFATALTGRDAGNDPDAWVAIGILDSEYAPFLTIDDGSPLRAAFSPVPEPGANLLLCAGATLFLVNRRRKA